MRDISCGRMHEVQWAEFHFLTCISEYEYMQFRGSQPVIPLSTMKSSRVLAVVWFSLLSLGKFMKYAWAISQTQ